MKIQPIMWEGAKAAGRLTPEQVSWINSLPKKDLNILKENLLEVPHQFKSAKKASEYVRYLFDEAIRIAKLYAEEMFS